MSDGPWSLLAFALPFLLVAVVPRVMDMLENGQRIKAQQPASRVTRLQALEFVGQHPQLQALSDTDALTVAQVLRETLTEQAKASRRFDIGLAFVSGTLGVLAGRFLQ